MMNACHDNTSGSCGVYVAAFETLAGRRDLRNIGIGDPSRGTSGGGWSGGRWRDFFGSAGATGPDGS